MFKVDNACYFYILVVSTEDVVNEFDVVLAAIAVLAVTMLVSYFLCKDFRHFAMSVRNEFICSKWMMFVMFLSLLLVLRML